MIGKLLGTIGAFILAASTSWATTVDFTEVEFPGTNVQANSQYSSYGLTFSNAYFYVDSRDGFDGQGIANNPGSGRIDFASATQGLTFDYVNISQTGINLTAFDSVGGIVDSFSGSALNGSGLVSGLISYITWTDSGGTIGLSTLTFSPIPVPAGGVLLIGALGGLVVLRRRKKS